MSFIILIRCQGNQIAQHQMGREGGTCGTEEKTCRVGVGKPHVRCSIKCGEFLGQLRNYKLRKKNSAPS